MSDLIDVAGSTLPEEIGEILFYAAVLPRFVVFSADWLTGALSYTRHL